MGYGLLDLLGGGMKSLMLLWQVLAHELGEECCVSTSLDFKRVKTRFEHEGMPFLAITLPQFCKDFEKSLAQEAVDRSSFQGFSWRGSLPTFLGGFFDLVFDRRSGQLLDRPDAVAIYAIRSLTLFIGKVEIPASTRRQVAAIEGYVECEKEVERCDAARSSSIYSEFTRASLLLFGKLLDRADTSLRKELGTGRGLHTEYGSSGQPTGSNWPFIHPKHGPGATADRLGGNAKFDLTEWPSRLEAVFPFGEYCIPNWRYRYLLNRVDFLEPGMERAAKLVSVPKTLKTPRLIAKEPTAMQYMQQAVQGLLVKSIQRDFPIGKMIGFDDQEANHLLCHRGSLSGELATLDLSEASDRVSNRLVMALFAQHPHVSEAVQATRSMNVDVPGHGRVALSKYASMGSALTFPVEAMVFLTAVFMGIARGSKSRLSPSIIRSMVNEVRVYGDDIIVPTEYAESVIGALEDLGLKVNLSKSFWTGKFRESCGKEYYAGTDVSVVRLRHLSINPDGEWNVPTSRRDDRAVESLVSLRNRCYAGGLWKTAYWLDAWLGSLLGGLYPVVLAHPDPVTGEMGSRSHGLVRWSVVGYVADLSLLDTQAPMVRCWTRVQETPESLLRDEGALTKVLSYRGIEPLALDHLDHAGRPTSSTLKRRMTSPF
nr:MAG: hypothetical protein 3 [Leviviridae sp.]